MKQDPETQSVTDSLYDLLKHYTLLQHQGQTKVEVEVSAMLDYFREVVKYINDLESYINEKEKQDDAQHAELG